MKIHPPQDANVIKVMRVTIVRKIFVMIYLVQMFTNVKHKLVTLFVSELTKYAVEMQPIIMRIPGIVQMEKMNFVVW